MSDLSYRTATLSDRLRSVAVAFWQDQGGRGTLLPEAHAAVGWLADVVDRFVHDLSLPEEAEHRFLEGSAAFLAILLVDHLGGQVVERGKQTQILLGENGSFDPFASMDRVLDDSDTDQALRRVLRSAEAEANSSGDTARVVAMFRTVLSELRPELSITDRFGYRVFLGDDIEVDLSRISPFGDNPALLHAGSVQLTQLLPGADASIPLSWSLVETRLIPRLVGQRFLSTLGDSAEQLWSTSFGKDVFVTLQLQFETRSRFVRQAEVLSWQEEGHDPFAMALKALAFARKPRFAQEIKDEGVLLIGRTGDGLDATRALLPDVRDDLREQLGTKTVIAIPHRDTLIAGNHAGLVARVAKDAFARAPHPISEAVFRL